MSILILRFAAALYAAATAAHIFYFAQPRQTWLAKAGGALLLAAFVVHSVAIGAGCREFGGTEFFSLGGGVALMVWLGAGAFLLFHRFYRLPTIGAFVTPFLLALLVPEVFGTPGHPELPSATVRKPVLILHIFSAIGGVALLGIAFSVAIMYLLQEREVKGKKFGPLFARLPPLEVLDRMVQRLVPLGFVVFTVALVAGTITATAVWKRAWLWDPQQIVATVVWLLYGTLVKLRHIGLHGRRYAVLTIAGFVIALGGMVSLRSVPGLTRHQGNYGTVSTVGGQ